MIAPLYFILFVQETLFFLFHLRSLFFQFFEIRFLHLESYNRQKQIVFPILYLNVTIYKPFPMKMVKMEIVKQPDLQ